MKSDNNRDTDSEKSITEKTNQIIEQFLDRMGFRDSFPLIRKEIKAECDKVLPYYVEIILSYQKASKEQSVTGIVKDFIKKYQAFSDKIQEVILQKDNKGLDEMIYMAWQVVLKELLAELPKNIDNYFVLQLIAELSSVYDKMLESKGIKPYKKGKD